MKTNVVQKAVILDDQQRVLMLRRSKTDVRRPLQWDLPGGLYEDGEELLASVLREIKEETSLEINAIRPVYSKTEIRTWQESATSKKTDNLVFIFYLAHAAKTDVILSYEHSEYEWKTIPEALEEFEYPLHIEVLQHVMTNHLV